MEKKSTSRANCSAYDGRRRHFDHRPDRQAGVETPLALFLKVFFDLGQDHLALA